MPHINLEEIDRNYEFSSKDFKHIQRLIYNHAGITVSDSRQEMVYGRIIRRIRARNLKTFAAYFNLLDLEAQEMEAFVNSMTTNLTSFFREKYHFPILKQHLLNTARRPLRIWCAAASTGEEPYSIAITCMHAFNSMQPPVEIIATDIDTNVLAIAERGIYADDCMSQMPFEVSKYFLRGKGNNKSYIKVKPEVRSLVTFRSLNLIDSKWLLPGHFDAVFCRNVLIYFDKETQRCVLERFVPLMTADALLFVGHSESLLHLGDLFSLRGKTVYERR